ncbi:hypothetical protein CRUP_014519 [Coryphaenoides rupestris]|nr:hypothetical protein CRUP_014519 [Coryphaenoides rupestris]
MLGLAPRIASSAYNHCCCCCCWPPRPKRVKALVDCRAVGSEQLAFFKDEVIVVTATDDLHWWVGHIEGDSSRSGTFPVNYVHKLGD